MQIQEGKFYRTRDGRKVGPMVVSTLVPRMWVSPKNQPSCAWFYDGVPAGAQALEYGALVAEWTEEPALARPEVDPSKIKAGDRVAVWHEVTSIRGDDSGVMVQRRNGTVRAVVWDEIAVHESVEPAWVPAVGDQVVWMTETCEIKAIDDGLAWIRRPGGQHEEINVENLVRAS